MKNFFILSLCIITFIITKQVYAENKSEEIILKDENSVVLKHDLLPINNLNYEKLNHEINNYPNYSLKKEETKKVLNSQEKNRFNNFMYNFKY